MNNKEHKGTTAAVTEEQAENGSSENEDGEEILSAGDRASLLAHDPGLPHEQEASGGSGDNPVEEAKEQDRGVLDGISLMLQEEERKRRMDFVPARLTSPPSTPTTSRSTRKPMTCSTPSVSTTSRHHPLL